MEAIIEKAKANSDLKQRVICLTDGCVDNPAKVIELTKPKILSVHTIGIGESCDK